MMHLSPPLFCVFPVSLKRYYLMEIWTSLIGQHFPSSSFPSLPPPAPIESSSLLISFFSPDLKNLGGTTEFLLKYFLDSLYYNK